MEMKLRFCESKIDYWANRYTERQREKNRDERTTGDQPQQQSPGARWLSN